VFGLYFSLVGIGLNLVFGVMRIVNLAHGAFLMLGAYAAYWLYHLLGLSPLLAAPICLVAFLLLGLPLYALVVPRLQRARDAEMLSLILFFGLAQIIEALASLAFGVTEQSIPGRALAVGPVRVLGQALPLAWALSAAASLAAVALVGFYLYGTRLGLLTRAVMASREEALATGVDVHRVSAVAFGLGIGLAAVAGVFAPFMLGSITPAMGDSANAAAFAVIVLGTLGNPLGTVLGGVLYGISLLLMQTYLSSWANLLPNVLLILVLLVRPSGLLGRRVRLA
jgi:branched-chain amino acid transport system permease protein